MRIRFAVPLTLAVFLTLPALAQRPGGEHQEGVHGNQGHIPQAPPKRESHAKPEIERREGGRVNNIPHVAHDHWYGHDRPNDRRYVLAHPFEHGHFEHFGPSYRYHVERFDRDYHRSGSLAVFRLRLRRGTGPLPPNGAGIATATALSCTTIPIILVSSV